MCQFYNTLVWKLLPSSAVKRWLYLVEESIFPIVMLNDFSLCSRFISSPNKILQTKFCRCRPLRCFALAAGLFKSASQSTASASAGSLEVNEAVRKFPSRPKPANANLSMEMTVVSMWLSTPGSPGTKPSCRPWRLSALLRHWWNCR